MIIKNIPTRVITGKRKHRMISLNLNQYRNLHYHVLNSMKHQILAWFKINVKKPKLIKGKVRLEYTIYRGSKRRVDLMNIGSVLDKFVSDALVHIGILPDDDVKHITEVFFIDGGIDKNDAHADLEVILK